MDSKATIAGPAIGSALNVKAPEKHESLNSAINRLDDVNDSLEDFIDKVTGCDSPRCDKETQQGVSLSSILDTAPNRIADIAEQISNKIHSLDQLLF